jgi:endonuclease/exonuclease/phosphatase family metal-dependent hydrolase
MLELRVLTWNLWHGRSQAGSGRDLVGRFASALAGWPWDVALLQEIPPWWPDQLGQRLQASSRSVLTSRNSLLFLRRALAVRWPDAIKSNGGGSNAILVRNVGRPSGLEAIDEHRVRRLSLLPERRWLHAVRLGSVWVGNLHTEASADQGELAASVLLDWAGGLPAVLGGDFNRRSFSLPGYSWIGGSGVDHVFASGPEAAAVEVLERGPLSDHAPVLTRIAWPSR